MTDLKFEDCLARLEQIVGRLETGNLPLEESLKIFASSSRSAGASAAVASSSRSGAAARRLA